VNVKLFPLATFIGRSYSIVRFFTSLHDIPLTVIPTVFIPILIQAFISYNLDMHLKKDFLLIHSQDTVIEKFFKLLKAFPERIVITKSNGSDPEGKIQEFN
jgi:hypothetical protein